MRMDKRRSFATLRLCCVKPHHRDLRFLPQWKLATAGGMSLIHTPLGPLSRGDRRHFVAPNRAGFCKDILVFRRSVWRGAPLRPGRWGGLRALARIQSGWVDPVPAPREERKNSASDSNFCGKFAPPFQYLVVGGSSAPDEAPPKGETHSAPEVPPTTKGPIFPPHPLLEEEAPLPGRAVAGLRIGEGGGRTAPHTSPPDKRP